MRKIKLTNSLTRKKEPLELVQPNSNHVGIYACGVTVYDDCHIGHAMQAIYFDVIRKYLRYAGYDVKYVRNYTDVDDKIINRAATLGISPAKLASDMIESSVRDMKAIGVDAPDEEPRVSETIPEIIAMVKTLIDKGFAYATKQGDVYYKVRKKIDYGKLSGRKPDELRSGTRDIVQGDKEDELDFALWKADDTKDASWESPWGKGRPGWHIECSAMAKKTLGDRFEIHGGGRDLIFPHHENELAQSEAANSCAFSNHWIHSGLLSIDHQKMSKSLGNHISIKKFLEEWPPEVLRLAFLQNQYSSNVDFSENVFKNCFKRLIYFYETLLAVGEISEGVDKNTIEKLHDAMSDDFNSSLAVSVFNVTMRGIREQLAGKKNPEKLKLIHAQAAALKEFGNIFGILQQDPKGFIETAKRQILPKLGITEVEIEQKMQERTGARAAKDFAKSDALRAELLGRGIEVRDTPQGQLWSISDSE